MQYYTFLKRLIATTVILYFVIGNFSWYRYQIEIFPIYSWDLFSYIPNLATDYGLKINAINHTDLDQPAYFQELNNYFDEADSIIAVTVIQNLGHAIENNDAEAIDNLRLQIESIYFSNHDHVQYEITKRTYYANERWRSGKFEDERGLAVYDSK